MPITLPIAQHQNGFLKVALPLGGRLHVWSPWNPPVVGADAAEVHDHPFAFSSMVLAGEMTNILLRAVEDVSGDYVENTAACVTSFAPQPQLQPSQRRVRLVEDGAVIVRRGEMYKMSPWQLHRTDAVFALTLFHKGQQAEGHSHIYVKQGAIVAEFRPAHEDLLRMSLERALAAARLTLKDISEIEAAQRWHSTRANQTLLRQALLAEPGYHLRDLPRSPHGSAGKVVEEALELAEAVEQGASIMALCECADVVSALRGYLRAEHGESFEDVVKMADVTERAFRSGRR